MTEKPVKKENAAVRLPHIKETISVSRISFTPKDLVTAI